MGIAVVVLLVGVAGLGSVHPFGNPRIDPARGRDALLQRADLPADAKKALVSKCADCHSNETRWPVYARIAPGSWLIERDIVQARAKMNLSRWGELSADDRDVLTAKMIQETREGAMPPVQYLALHWGARLTAADIAALRSMSKAPLIEDGSDGLGQAPGDAVRGKLVFQKRCTGCHAMEGDREGPRLAGVFGRKAGSVAGFAYSEGLRKSGLTWNEATLERWLSDPDSVVPDAKMDFHVPKAQERKDLIAYFKQ